MEETKVTTNQTMNIDLPISDKVRYTINGREDKYIELNPGDMGIIARFDEMIPVLNGIVEKYEKLKLETKENDSEEDFTKALHVYSEGFREIESSMRDAVNKLFDYDVCSVCAGGGSMLDPYNGEYRFIVILQTLLGMYGDTISAELKKMSTRLHKHTDKYKPKDHQTTSRKK